MLTKKTTRHFYGITIMGFQRERKGKMHDNLHKSDEKWREIGDKKRSGKKTRGTVQNKPVRVQRFGNPFQNADNGMSEDIPTSGTGWTLK
jgi:hypothetical protein